MNNKRIINTAIYMFNIIVILMYSGAFSTSGELYSNYIFPLFTKVNNIISLVGIVLILNNYNKSNKKIIIYNKWILFFLLTIYITTSIAMIKRSNNYFYLQMLTGTIIYGMILANYFSIDYILRLLVNCQIIIIIYTLFITLSNPSIGLMIDTHGMVWKGAFSHKNSLGSQMAIGAIVYYIYLKTSTKNNKSIIYCVFLLLDIFILIKTGSKTAIVTLSVSILSIYLYNKKWMKINIGYLLIFINFIFYIIVVKGNTIVTFVANILGKDPTLTGRVYIWDIITVIIAQKPYIGYGYSSFWTEYPEINKYIWSNMGFEFYGSHNGILEWLLLIGIMGVGVLLINFILTGYRAVRIRNRKVKYLSISYITYLLIYYMSEVSTNPLEYKVLLLFLVISIANKYYIDESYRNE